jgi:transposase
MSKRTVQSFCHDVLGTEISLGEVAALEQTTATALDTPVAEAREYVRQQEAVGVDETGWHEAKHRAWLWVAVTGWVTVFSIRLSRGAKVAKEMLGECFRGVVISDRWTAYNYLSIRRRQMCWAHLRRDFQAMIDRGGKAATIGRSLLGHSDVLFTWWHRVRDGTMARATFEQYVMRLLRPAFGEDLKAVANSACAKTAATCRELQSVETALWTFVRHSRVAPTNNASERTLRHAVMWRKTSYGTDSQAGSHFVENI